MQNILDFNNVSTQPVRAHWLPAAITLNVLRLDKIHPIVSGNKWFKLKYYLEEAKQTGFKTVATFGGAYSNHIIAAAFACKASGFSSIGIIRGERPPVLSSTLQYAAGYGMQLQFVSRQSFNNKENIKSQFPGVYWIDEGGYGLQGMCGAGEIMQLVDDAEKYSHIVCAVGTGTMFAGIVRSAAAGQRVIGVSVLKNNFSIFNEVQALLDKQIIKADFDIVHGYHFGGYAKHPPALIDFMHLVWNTVNLPTDIVYTAKTLYAIQQLALQNTIPVGNRVLMIHSGGLQGNTSLQKGVLPF
ncbi:MAG TPA: pyridoxal-phosphate dependent enzyme [Chitinophagaceae bacterium]|nr:pyridoxal-phosphate dependent enzyme [Chitinophagaceae bacterium]